VRLGVRSGGHKGGAQIAAGQGRLRSVSQPESAGVLSTRPAAIEPVCRMRDPAAPQRRSGDRSEQHSVKYVAVRRRPRVVESTRACARPVVADRAGVAASPLTPRSRRPTLRDHTAAFVGWLIDLNNRS